MRRLLLAFLVACGATHTPNAPASTPPSPSPASFGAWRPLSYGELLAPEEIPERIDVIFHFHAGKAAEPEYRAAGLRAAIVAVTVPGMGTTPYWDLMDDPSKFDAMRGEVVRVLAARAKHPVAIGRVAIFAWSAGYASAQRILAIEKYYDAIDALVLLDGPHTGWVESQRPKGAQIQTVGPFVRFMRDARAGKKLFVMTHSSITTTDYASTTEVADALAKDLGAPFVSEARPGPPGAYRALDAGDAHLRGYRGDGARDHVIQDHFVRDVIDAWLRPRWR